jgi:hypothetical protein
MGASGTARFLRVGSVMRAMAKRRRHYGKPKGLSGKSSCGLGKPSDGITEDNEKNSISHMNRGLKSSGNTLGVTYQPVHELVSTF